MSSSLHARLVALLATLSLSFSALGAGGGAFGPDGDFEAALLGAGPAVSPAGKVFMNRDEALQLAFPDCEVERATAYLDPKHVKRIAALSKLEYESAVAYTYRATKKGKWVGTAYFDTHRVRSMRETVMVVVKPDASLGRIEVLSFGEPVEYIPRDRWYGQFKDHKLDGDLFLGRDIRGVTGATLTAVATTNCSRRVLALHQVLAEIAKAKREEAAKKKKAAEEKKKREAERKRIGAVDDVPGARSAGAVFEVPRAAKSASLPRPAAPARAPR